MNRRAFFSALAGAAPVAAPHVRAAPWLTGPSNKPYIVTPALRRLLAHIEEHREWLRAAARDHAHL